jgi:hypothetical protein
MRFSLTSGTGRLKSLKPVHLAAIAALTAVLATLLPASLHATANYVVYSRAAQVASIRAGSFRPGSSRPGRAQWGVRRSGARTNPICT